MTAAEQRELAAKLQTALVAAGVRVTQGFYQGGNLVRWNDVPPEALLGAWMARAWRIEVAGEQVVYEVAARPTLVLA